MLINSSMTAVIAVIAAILYLIFMLLIYKKRQEYDTKRNFECGFEAKLKYNTGFSVNYFFLAIVLVVFDLEVVLIVVSVNQQGTIYKITSMLAFVLFFTALLVFEWYNTILEWE